MHHYVAFPPEDHTISSTMAKSKPKPEEPESEPEPKVSGRMNFKYVGIPVDLWDELKAIADSEDRSVNWMARKAIREFVRRKPTD